MNHELEENILKKKLLSTPREEWVKLIAEAIEITKTDYPDADEVELKKEFHSLAAEISRERALEEFKPLSLPELAQILGLTIKRDEENKIITFLCQLSTYTEDSQFNVSYNAPSSTGKSFIPMEIATLFPQEDLMQIGWASPMSFYHERGEPFGEKKDKILVDLSRKILIFLDMPHNQLIERLRPLLSHDEKEIKASITDKNQKHGMRSKKVILRGFPSVIFCTAGLKIDEQESTRFILLSPQTNQEKIRESILESIKKNSNRKKYRESLHHDPARVQLQERIRAIKHEGIEDINIANPEKIGARFLTDDKALKPRGQRDIKRVMDIIKSIALLNLWFREREGNAIIASDEDIEAGFAIWEKIFVSQELNLPPYVYDFYKEVVEVLWAERRVKGENVGITRQDILQKHYKVYGRLLDNNKLRWEILPTLESAGLIHEEPDLNDKRRKLIYPTSTEPNNSEEGGGVEEKKEKDNDEIAF